MENRQLNTFIRKYTANYNYEKHKKKMLQKKQKQLNQTLCSERTT